VKERTGPVGTISVFTLKGTDTTVDLRPKGKRAGEERKEKVEKVGEGSILLNRNKCFW